MRNNSSVPDPTSSKACTCIKKGLIFFGIGIIACTLNSKKNEKHSMLSRMKVVAEEFSTNIEVFFRRKTYILKRKLNTSQIPTKLVFSQSSECVFLIRLQCFLFIYIHLVAIRNYNLNVLLNRTVD